MLTAQGRGGWHGRNRGEESDRINNCEKMEAKNSESPAHGLLEGNRARLHKADLPLILAFCPLKRQAGRAENLGALLSLSFFLLSLLPGQQRAMGSNCRTGEARGRGDEETS